MNKIKYDWESWAADKYHKTTLTDEEANTLFEDFDKEKDMAIKVDMYARYPNVLDAYMKIKQHTAFTPAGEVLLNSIFEHNPELKTAMALKHPEEMKQYLSDSDSSNHSLEEK